MLSPLTLSTVGLASLAIAAPLEHRVELDLETRQQAGGLPALQQAITGIGIALANANNSVVPFVGGSLSGLTGLLNINSAVISLGGAITTTTNIAKNTTTLNVADSATLGVQFLGLQPNINLLLSNLQAKKAEFDKAGFGILDVRSLIRDDLTIQQQGAGDLGTSLTTILNPSISGVATTINTQIQGNFTAAVNTFQGKGGVIAIPADDVPALSNILDKLAKLLDLGGVPSQGASTATVASGVTVASSEESDANDDLILPDFDFEVGQGDSDDASEASEASSEESDATDDLLLPEFDFGVGGVPSKGKSTATAASSEEADANVNLLLSYFGQGDSDDDLSGLPSSFVEALQGGGASG